MIITIIILILFKILFQDGKVFNEILKYKYIT